MTEYVAGFMFNENGEVALVRKNRPSWQAGRYNGIGGHIEQGETPIAAMVREFREETGVFTYHSEWWPFAVLNGDGFKVHFFATHSSDNVQKVKTMTDEEIVVVPAKDVTPHNAIPNLTWLIPMAKSIVWDRADAFHIQEVR